jgi:predicted nucleic-acid-binding Zn-ribbon protein
MAMNAQEFVRKFPKAESRKNLLHDMACPHCGNRESFAVEIATTAVWRDEGSEVDEDYECSPDSYCSCLNCETGGALRHFFIEGLDELIQSNNEPSAA